MTSGRLTLLRIAFLTVIAICVALDVRRGRAGLSRTRVALAAWAAFMVAFVAFLWVDHVGFPGHLDLMEGTILQHVAQAAHGLPVYPEPTPTYVPLAYNPLYYYLCVPFTWLLGLGLPTLRVVAILGMIGSGAVIFVAIRDRTASIWWAVIGVGLFATAYRVMDAYLDTAHSDSWLLCTALAGSYVIDRATTRAGRLAGVVLLVLSFWFKQHGALFALGGLVFLTVRGGWRAAVPYWALAAVLGPLAYAAAVSWPFGPAFHYFTWDVPRAWSRVDGETFARVIRFTAGNYLPLVAAACLPLVRVARRREPVSIWHVQFVVGIASAIMGSLDWGSSDNVFIPFGAFTIVLGTIGLAELPDAFGGALRSAAAAIAFVPLMYAPQTVILSRHAGVAYTDLVGVVRTLDGPVYAPGIGQSAGTPLFSPGAHWVALEDMLRGPGHDAADSARARALLAPLFDPAGRAYILTSTPRVMETPPLASLADRYTLARDFGTRFAALAGLPKRYDHKFPRYLYVSRDVPRDVSPGAP
ncbi:MAG TPA: hypothetical protein VNW46_15650 [Gemmatimonadaceae bacterium]|jgi:hypothetical protein|nr:hypothetical protein [Gemmatimonadaceae bacterium]